MDPESKEKLSKALKEKWASGTRKKNPEGYGKKISAKLKIAHAEGRMHKVTHEASMKGLAARDMEKVRAAAKRVAAQKVGVPNPPGPSAKSPEHWKARYWILKAPNQKIIQGWNLNELIRQNAELFLPDDVKWYGKSNCECRASKGIRRLFEMKKDGSGPRVLSWKGWMIGDRRDEEPNVIYTTSIVV
jgi:hypothetical protein